ncbi:MAG: four helix bundle protein [Acidobacteriia bacterium]|nr:four helix bundle protein [Terriglobia bacterium]
MENADGPKSYRDLLVWQKAMLLVKEIYELTRGFPQDERFGLVSQLRRAAVSVPSNIAEGQARHTTKEFIQFISHAQGSAAELDTQLMLAQDLSLCSPQQAVLATAILEEVRKMLNGLRRKLNVRAA